MPRSARKKRKHAPPSPRPLPADAHRSSEAFVASAARAEQDSKLERAMHAALALKASRHEASAVAALPTQLAARSRARRRWLWALAAMPLLPLLTARAWIWPSAPEAFLVAYAWSLALCAPIGALRSSLARLGAPNAWLPGALIGALAATPIACLLLWAGALSSLARAPQSFGGQLVDISCGTLSCQAGLYDHDAQRYSSFRLRPQAAPAITGSTRHLCLRPGWPQPVRAAWENLYAGCAIPEQIEPADPRP